MTAVHVHLLRGCTPTPLAHYLKALGILRLISKQADPAARGFWRDDYFNLVTALDRTALDRFFLHEYQPTPLVAPWNQGSGFYYKEDKGLDPLERSTAPRLRPVRDGIAAARAISAPFAAAIAATKAAEEAFKQDKKSEEKKAAVAAAKSVQAEMKATLLMRCRSSWRGPLLEWLDAALVLAGDGSPEYPALLGTGGNDGRLDFTNNFMQRLGILFLCDDPLAPASSMAESLLPVALYADPGAGLVGGATGQFQPGRAGGANMSAGFDGPALSNPWDFVLMMEGALAFVSGMARRADVAGAPQAAAPFAVRASAIGYGIAAAADESARGEQWMPLWSEPALYPALCALLSEGRARFVRESTQRPVDFARAVARLGVARGIEAFQRFGYLELNGQSNLAVPIGRFVVAPQPHQDLLNDVDRWLNTMRAVTRDDLTPRALRSAVRDCDEAVLAVCRVGSDRGRWQQLLMSLARAEAALLRTPKTTVERRLRPLSHLSPGWLRAADDGRGELRLALALASQGVRRHFLPLGDDRESSFATDAGGLRRDADVVCTGQDLVRDCLALMSRQVVLGRRDGEHGLPLRALPGCEAHLADINNWLDGQLSDARILGLAQGLMALDWKRLRAEGNPLGAPLREGPDALYAALRLTHLPAGWHRGGGRGEDDLDMIRLDPETILRLDAGDLTGALKVCLRRLRAAGLRPVLREGSADPMRTQRLGASLAFPLCERDIWLCARLITKPDSQGTAVTGA